MNGAAGVLRSLLVVIAVTTVVFLLWGFVPAVVVGDIGTLLVFVVGFVRAALEDTQSLWPNLTTRQRFVKVVANRRGKT